MDRLYDFRRPTAVVFAAFEEVRPESISSSGNGLPRNKRNLKKFGYDALSLNTLRQATNANIPRAFDSTQYANYDANNAAVGDAKFQSQERPVINMFYGTDLYPSFHI
ncbi:hypothetical protein HDU84_002891 [Entophlyctis sp. JEL0112]|nr:hypothetical protein HDU84_002891 [Entophlyctis sp. JEL0112]